MPLPNGTQIFAWANQKTICSYLIFLVAGFAISLCLVGFCSVLFVWQTSDPGCSCFTQRIYISRVRWEKLKHYFECSAFILAPLVSILMARHASGKRIVRIFVSLIAAVLTYLALTSDPIYMEKPASYFLFLNAGKIVAYSYNDIARLIVQPMFSWAFIQSSAAFVIFYLVTMAVEFVIKKRHIFGQRTEIEHG
jgi:hypothetical protein